MIDSYSGDPRIDLAEAIPDTQEREAAEDIDAGHSHKEDQLEQAHPLSRTSLKGLKKLLQAAEEEAASQGRTLDPRDPICVEHDKRIRYIENRQDYLDKRFAEIVSAPRLLIIDIEATCFKGQPADVDMDVIEIGGVLIDGRTLETVDEVQMYTKPTHTEVGEFCTELTGITPEMVANAPSFVERMKELGEFVRSNEVSVWASFGMYDPKKIARQCARDGVENPLENIPHVNIKVVAGFQLGFGKLAPGLGVALNLAEIPRQGRAHSGLDDARNIVSLIGKILRDRQLVDEDTVENEGARAVRRPKM